MWTSIAQAVAVSVRTDLDSYSGAVAYWELWILSGEKTEVFGFQLKLKRGLKELIIKNSLSWF